MITLHANKRTADDTLSKIRAKDFIPAVVYGAGMQNTPVSVSREEFREVWKHAGTSGAFSLVLSDGDHDCVIHEFQADPISGAFSHIDFLALEKGKKVTVHVELEFTGTAPATKSNEGVLTKVLHEIEIEALPKDLPHTIPVSIEGLAHVDDHVAVKDLVLPSGVIALTDPEAIVVTISHIHEEKEEEAAPIDFASIEVEKKGKQEEEEIPAE